MKYLLLISLFTGPTSPDQIKFLGWYKSEKECLKAYNNYKSNLKWYQTRLGNSVCIPFGEIK